MTRGEISYRFFLFVVVEIRHRILARSTFLHSKEDNRLVRSINGFAIREKHETNLRKSEQEKS